ncbi:MAG: hypothetical protein AAYR33_08925 [Acetobacteraceae bacterium]
MDRGLALLARTGNNSFLLHWKQKLDSGEYLTEMKEANAVEDLFSVTGQLPDMDSRITVFSFDITRRPIVQQVSGVRER